MKVYTGEHFGMDGVFVEDGGRRRQLRPDFSVVAKWPEGFAWGRRADPKIAGFPISVGQLPMHPGAAQLAFAILEDFTGSKEIARRAYMRFAYRTTATFNPNEPFVLPGPEIEQHLAMMKAIESEEWTRQQKEAVARARPIPVSEFGADIVWDQYEEPKVNASQK